MNKSFFQTMTERTAVILAMGLMLLSYAFPQITLTQVAQAATGTPEVISYQGRLTDSSGQLLGGAGTNYYFKFSIWDNATVGSGSKVWPAGSPGTTTASVSQGVFNVNIGDTANGYPDALDFDFQSNDTVYLQVEVSPNVGGPFETLSPRQQISSSGYAINANSVLGHTPGTGANNILLLDGSGDINISGDIVTSGILQSNTLTPTGSLTVGSASQTALLQGSIVNITSTGAGNDVIINSADTIELQDDTNITGSLDVSGVIRAGSGNVNITLADGTLDASALGLITGGGSGSASSGSGLEVVSNKLGLLQGCADNDILKWNDSLGVWACAVDASGVSAISLQNAYDTGNIITTADNKDIDLVLADTATDSNLDIDLLADNTVSISRNNGASTEAPAQLLLLENLDTDLTIAAGMLFNVATGGALTTAVDASDADIVTAIAIGNNDVTVGGATISSAEFAALDNGIDLASEVTGILPAANGGTGVDTSAAGNGTLLIGNGSGLTLATLTQGSGITITNGSGTITIASTLGTSVDLTSEVTGVLPVANGGTGASSLNDLITLGTHTVGNYVATITGNTQIGVSGSGSENAGVGLSINGNSIGASQLASTLTFADGDLIDLSSINTSSTSEGLKLPQATSCAAGTAEGQICWDTDGDFLSLGTGSGVVTLLGSSSSLFTAAGTSGSSQTISAGDTLTIAAGAGITTTAGATDTITIASTLGTSVDLTSEVTGVLPVANGGTGASSLADLIVLGTDTTGNYVATITGSSQISVSGSGSENAAVTVGIVTDSIGDTQLAFNTGQDLTTASSPSFAGLTATDNIIINKADPALVFDTATVSDTDFWMGVTEDGAGDDDDLFQIGNGTTPGTNPSLTINTSGQVGIGTATPTWLLDVQGSSAIGQFKRIATNANQAPGFLFTRARGTPGSESNIISGNQLGKIQFRGRISGLDTDYGALIYMADGTTAGDGHFAFTQNDLSTEILTIETDTGNVGIGTSSPESLLEVQATEGNSAILTLDADDGDDTADTWQISSLASNNSLSFSNDVTEVASLSSSGALQLDSLISGGTQCLQANSSGVLSGTGSACGTAVGTLFTAAGTSGSSQTISAGDTLTIAAGAGITTTAGATDTITIASTLGTSVDLTSEVTGVLPVANGGTGATSLNNLITLGTHTTGNYVATIAGSSQVSVSGSGSENAGVTLGIVADSIDDSQLAFNTGQDLTTTSDVEFGSISLYNGGEIELNTSDGVQIYPDNSGSGTFLVTNSIDYDVPALQVNTEDGYDAGGLTSIYGYSLDTESDGAIAAADISFTFYKDDNNTRNFAGVSIHPYLYAGASNANTTLDILSIDTYNDSTTGLTTNLIKASYGGVQQFLVDAGGVLTAASLAGAGTQCLQTDNSGTISGTGSACGTASGTLFTTAGTSGSSQTISAGDTLTIAAGAGITTTGGATDTITIASTLGTSVDLTSEVTGILPVANGGTGAASLNNLITLGTHTTGNYVATIAGSSQLSVSGSGSESAAVTLGIVADSIGDTQLAFNTGQDLTTADSPEFTGLTLSGLAGGGAQCLQIDNAGVIGATGDSCGTSTGISSLQLIGSSGGAQTLNDGDTITIAAGSGITTVSGATDTVTITATLGTSVDLTSEVTGVLPVANGGTGTSTAFTAGSIVFAGASGTYTQDNANFFWDDSNDYLGINTNTPSASLQVAGDAIIGESIVGAFYTPAPLALVNSAGGTLKTQLNLVNTGGGPGAGSAIDFYTYTTAGNGEPESRIGSIDDGNYSAGLSFYTKDPGNTGNNGLLNRLQIMAGGNVGIGDDTPAALLTVGSSDAFQVDNSGIITSASLAGSGTQCLQADNSGVISGTGAACVVSGGTLFTAAATSGSNSTIAQGDTLTVAAGSGITTTGNGSGTITIASTLGTSVDLTSEVTGVLPVANGGTGASSLANLIVLGTDTTGNYVATVSGSSQISVSGSGSESAGVTLGITNDSIGDAQLTYDTGQDLTTASSPTFDGLTVGGVDQSGVLTLHDDDGFTNPFGAPFFSPSSDINGQIKQITDSGGGVLVTGVSGDGASNPAVNIAALVGSADPDDDLAAIQLSAFKSDGSGFIAALGDSETLLSVLNVDVPKFNILGDGTIVDSSLSGSGTQCLQADNSGVISGTGSACGTAVGTLFTAAGTSGSSQTISAGDTLTIAAGAGITTTAGATDTITIASTLGTSVDLTSEVTGVLPVANGGTGASSLNDLITLGTHTTGNYVANAATGLGLTGGSAGSEGASLTLALDESQALTGNVALSANQEIFGQNGLVFEGSSADTVETFIAVANPTTSDKTITFPDNSGTVAVAGTGAISVSAAGVISCATCVVTGGTLFTAAGTSGSSQTISQGDTLTIAAGAGITTTGGATDTITIASTLGTSVDLTSEVTGVLPVANGGTGASSLANLIALATDTTGNYVATIAGNTQIGVSGSGSENASVSLSINGDSITTSQLSATLTFADGDLIDLSSINTSSTSEGLKLPQATSCASGTAEGQICWDTDGDFLSVGTGSGVSTILSTATTLFTLAGSSGSSQTITAGDTVTIAAGAGITTTGGATDTVTIASTLGTSVDLTSEVTGILPVANGGTGASSLNNLITLGTHTTGNYIATLADSGDGIFDITGSGSESAAVTVGIVADSIGDAQLTYDTGQDLTTADSPEFTGLTLSGLGGGGPQCLQVDNSGVIGVTGDSCGTSTGISSLQLAGTSGSAQTLNDGDTITIAAGAGITTTAGATDTVTIAATLGTSVDLTSEVTGVLPVANGGTGASSLNDLITLGTHTTGNYVATIAGNTQIGVSGSGSENAAVSLSINGDSITASQLSSTLTFADGDLIDLSAINTSSTSEGLKLPQATSCTSGTAEGQICWDTDGDFLSVGTGSGVSTLLAAGSSLFTAAATSGSNSTISQGGTLTVAAGAGITTTGNGSGTITIASTLGTSVDLTSEVTGVLPLANGGTNKNLTASNGAIVYSDADSFELLSGGTAGRALISGGSSAPTWFAPTAGSVLFAGTSGILQQDNAGLFYDDSTNRLGIGDNSPDYTLEISDSTNTPAVVLSDDDVNQPFTSVLQADGFLSLSSISTTAGGAGLIGVSDTDATGFIISGGIGSANPTDTTPAVLINGVKSDGSTGPADLGASETVLQIANNDNTPGFTILGNNNVGIGDTTPAALLTVGSSDAFQVDNSGVITSSSLAGSGTQCLQADNSGVISSTGSACGTAVGTLFTAAGTSGSSQTISAGDTLTIAAGAGITTTGGATDTITIASTLGTSVDLTSEVTGILPVANGGTGASSLNDLITLGTHTTGNYVATIAGNTQVGVSGSGSENASVSLSINGDSITASQLSSTLTFADGDLIDLSSINTSSTSEGLKLPQATSCASGTAEGQICWDTDNDLLSLGTGSGTVTLLGSSSSLFTAAGTSGSSQTISAGDTLTIAAGAGITTTGGATDTITIASTLGTSIDLTSEVTGVLPVANGGTGASSLNDLITLGTHTTGNYVATIAGSSQVSVSGSGSENAGVTLGIVNDSIGDTQLAFNTGQNLTTTSTPTFGALTVNGSITLANSETISNGTNSTITFGRNDSGTVTINAADNDSTAALTILPGGAAALTLGGASTTSITLTTDSTGDGEVVLPTGSIGTTEILDNTVSASDLAATLTFADGDLIDLSSINTSSTSEGLKLPQATSCTSGTAEGQICWDTDGDFLSVGTGSGVSTILSTATTLFTLAGSSGSSQAITAGDTLTIAAGAGITTTAGATDTVTIAATLGTSIDLTSEVTGILPVANGGTGASSLNDLITLGTHTTGNYVATIAGNTQIGVSGSGSESAAVSLSINTDSITASQLNATLTFADGDLIDLSSINTSSTSEGLKLPQATSCAAGTAEGQICWDTDGDFLSIGTGSGVSTLLATGSSLFTAAATSGSNSTISQGGTLTVAAGSGITTTGNGSGTITIASTLGTSIDLTSEVTGILPVANGGTGTSTAFTTGSIVFAGASGVYSQDNSNFFWDDTNNFLGLGINSSLKSRLNVVGTTTASGADAIAGTYSSLTLTNSTASGFQFGNRTLVSVNGSTAGTEVGNFIRMTDNTSLANTVRGLEVQSWSGTNTDGVNTGIAAFGKTFGVQATVDGLAGAVATPAAIFADLDNGSSPTSGNAIRAYSDNLTSADLVSFYQETSSFSGTGLVMDFGNNSGSFSGNFLNLKVAGSSKLSVSSAGAITTAGTTTYSGVTTDITTASGEDLTLVANGAGIISLNDSVTVANTLTLSSITGSTQCLQVNSSGVVSGTGSACGTGGGGITSFTLAGSSGSSQTITDGNTLTIAAGAGITTTAGATDTVTIASTLGTSVDLTSEVTGVLPVANGGTGTSTAFTTGSIVFAGASGVYTQDNANFFWDDSTNSLGIGDNTPTEGTLTVGGTADISGHVAIGADASVDDIDSGSGSQILLNLSESFTDLATNDFIGGISNFISVNPSADDDDSSVTGISNWVETDGANDVGYLTGSSNIAYHASDGDLVMGEGLYGDFTNDGAGTVDDAYGVRAVVDNNGSGTINNAYTFYTYTPYNDSGTIGSGYGIYLGAGGNSGTYNNVYGLYIEDQSGIASGSDFNVYSAGTGSINYFEGSVGIGDSTPAALLTVGSSDAFQVNGSGVITSASLAGGGTQCLQADNSGVISGTGSACGTAVGTLFTAAGTSGSSQTISAGDTLTIAAGSGITTTGGATDTITIASTLGTSVDLTSEVTGVLPLANGGTNKNFTAANGSIVYSDADSFEFLAGGTSGRALISGGSSAPSWFAPTAGSVLFAGTSGILQQDNSNFFWDDSTNSLGIGTTTPNSSTGMDGQNPHFAVVGYSNLGGLRVNGSDGNTLVSDTAIGISSDDDVTIASGGDIGIGTSSPQVPLDFQGDSTNNIVAKFSRTSSEKDLYLGANSSTNFELASEGTLALRTNYTGGDAGDPNSGTLGIFIDTAGNVGIGDASPAALFTVGSGDKFQVSSGGQALFNGVTTDITTGSGEDLTLVANGAGVISLNDSVTVANTLTLSSITGSTQCLQVDSSGVVSGTGSACGAGGGGMSIGGAVTSGTSGSVLFVDSSNNLAQDNSNFFWDDSNNRLGLGDTTPDSILNVEGSVTTSGAGAVAGILTELTLTNSTASGFQYGNRNLVTVNGGTAGTEVGSFIRMTDNTSLANTVRGLEVQAYSGTNNSGINTGIAAFGKTFGIQAETTAQAGSVVQAAAVFADLNNSSDGSLGNAIRAFSDDVTSANLVNFTQNTSAFTGAGLVMNFAASSGSFTGNFLDLQKNGTSKLVVDDTGEVLISIADADNTPAIYINTEESTSSQTVWAIESDTTNNSQSADAVKAHFNADGSLYVSFTGTGTANAVCHTGTGSANNDQLVDCTSTPAADYAEMYPVASGIEAGEVVQLGENTVNTYDQTNGQVDWTKVKGTIKQLVRAGQPYSGGIIGVVSDNYGDFISTGYNIKPEDNPKSIALNGRVPVRVNLDNGAIRPGDYLTASAVPGVAMRADKPGTVIGQALAAYDGTQADNRIMVFVRTSYYDPTMLVDGDGGILMQRGATTTTLMAKSSNAAFLINQDGVGDLLSLQANGADRFLVKNNGAVSINAVSADDTDRIAVIKSNDEEVFTISARGEVAIKGNIIVRDDSFAGSIATAQDGTAEIDFTYDLGTGKPSVQLTPESESPVFAQIADWKTDSLGRYTGFTIKTFGLGGAPTSATVHYLVVGKPDGYDTVGAVIQVVNAPDNQSSDDGPGTGTDDDQPTLPDDGIVAGDSTGTDALTPPDILGGGSSSGTDSTSTSALDNPDAGI